MGASAEPVPASPRLNPAEAAVRLADALAGKVACRQPASDPGRQPASDPGDKLLDAYGRPLHIRCCQQRARSPVLCLWADRFASRC